MTVLSYTAGQTFYFILSLSRKLRVFRISDWKMLSNFSLGCEANDFAVDEDGERIVVGGADGSVTFLVLADNAAENAGMI